MIRLSRRESILAIVTMALGLTAITWWASQSRWARWVELGQTKEALLQRRQLAERLVRRRAEVEAQLDQLLRALPRYPADRDVTADLLKLIETTAAEHGLILTRREPERERAAGELYEVAINCNWEGSLEALTRFLYAVQSRGAVLDVRQLTVTSPKGTSSKLSGSFTVVGAYTRAKAPAKPATAAPTNRAPSRAASVSQENSHS